MFAAPVGAAQTVRASLDAPSRRKSVASLVSWVSSPLDPPYRVGEDRLAAPRIARLNQLLGDERQRFVPADTFEACISLRPAPDQRVLQTVWSVEPLREAPHLGTDEAGGDGVHP